MSAEKRQAANIDAQQKLEGECGAIRGQQQAPPMGEVAGAGAQQPSQQGSEPPSGEVTDEEHES